MKKMCNIYEAYNEDGEVIARGFKSDVSWVLGITESGLDTAARSNLKIKGKYTVRYIGKKEKHYTRFGIPVDQELPSRQVEQKETFVERYGDLDRHGTTIMSVEEYSRHEMLIEDKGYKVKYTKIKRTREKPYYLLEVI